MLTITQPTPQKQRPLFEVLCIEPGSGSIIAICSLRLGGLTIYGVCVRRGRGGSTYVNMPSVRRQGRWAPAVELVSDKLRSSVEAEVLRAVAAVTR